MTTLTVDIETPEISGDEKDMKKSRKKSVVTGALATVATILPVTVSINLWRRGMHVERLLRKATYRLSKHAGRRTGHGFRMRPAWALPRWVSRERTANGKVCEPKVRKLRRKKRQLNDTRSSGMLAEERSKCWRHNRIAKQDSTDLCRILHHPTPPTMEATLVITPRTRRALHTTPTIIRTHPTLLHNQIQINTLPRHHNIRSTTRSTIRERTSTHTTYHHLPWVPHEPIHAEVFGRCTRILRLHDDTR